MVPRVQSNPTEGAWRIPRHVGHNQKRPVFEEIADTNIDAGINVLGVFVNPLDDVFDDVFCDPGVLFAQPLKGESAWKSLVRGFLSQHDYFF